MGPKKMSIFLAGLLAMASLAMAQEQSGGIQGRVVDSSRGALPGVTVTVSGPTIIGKSLTAVTGETGLFRVANIPIGTYQVLFEMSGFQSKAFEGIRVQTGVVLTLDAELGVATVQETVTVSGEAPVLDTAATMVSFNYTKELMSTIPNARDVWAMVNQTPGMTTVTLNVGGTNTGNQAQFRALGTDPRQNIFLLNGANVTDNTGGGSQYYFDVDSFEELQIQTNSHGAEVQTPGVLVNMVPKSGTNNLHATLSAFYGNDKMQSDNVDDALRARGVDRASNLKSYFDGGLDAGGPIAKDKVWFWGAFRRQDIQRYITGTKNADGSFPIDRTYLWYPSVKINWQAAKSHNVSGFFNMQQKKRFNSGLSALRPVETTNNQQNDPVSRLVTLRDDWIVNPHLFVNLKFNYSKGAFRTTGIDGVNTDTTPVKFDTATGAYRDAPPSLLQSARAMKEAGATFNYAIDNFAGGRHDIKAGFNWLHYEAPVITTFPADSQLNFFNGNPLEVLLYAPGMQNSVAETRSAFVQDSWHAGRATIDLGVRFDNQVSSLPAETAPQGRYFPAVQQAQTGNLISWANFAPRLGIIYDLSGDAKTLLKGSYSRYYWQVFTSKASQTSTSGARTYRYRWNDLNKNNLYDPGELGDLVSVSDPSLSPISIDSGLKPTTTDEITLGIAHQLAANVSINGTFIYRKDNDLDWLINPNISPADYTAVTGTDPGPDGVRGTSDDGGAITFWELSTAKRTLSPNLLTTRNGFNQRYKGVELSFNRRLADGWQFVASVTFGTQSETYGTGSYQSPQPCYTSYGSSVCGLVSQLDGTRVDPSVPVIGKMMGSYALPKGISVSGFYQFLSGNPYTRWVNSQSALGRSLNQGNVVVLADTRNVAAYDTLHLADLRISYAIPVVRPKMTLSMDLFNMPNANTIVRAQKLSGSTFDRVIDFVPPRVVRFGLRVSF